MPQHETKFKYRRVIYTFLLIFSMTGLLFSKLVGIDQEEQCNKYKKKITYAFLGLGTQGSGYLLAFDPNSLHSVKVGLLNSFFLEKSNPPLCPASPPPV